MKPIAIAAGLTTSLLLLAAGMRPLIGRSARRYGRAVTDLAERRLADLFVFFEAQRILRLSLGMMGLAVVFGVLSGRTALALLALSVPLVPQTVYRWLLAARRRRFAVQLPDALMALAAALRSGSSLPQALAGLAARQPRPLCQEFELVARKQRLGVPLDLALAELAQRIPGADVALFATAVRIARELGGNLAEALERLGETLRRKLAMEARIRALTSQGRIQGVIVGLLPAFLLWVLTALEPEAMRPLFTTRSGWAVLAVLIVLETLGFLLIRRIVRIEV